MNKEKLSGMNIANVLRLLNLDLIPFDFKFASDLLCNIIDGHNQMPKDFPGVWNEMSLAILHFTKQDKKIFDVLVGNINFLNFMCTLLRSLDGRSNSLELCFQVMRCPDRTKNIFQDGKLPGIIDVILNSISSFWLVKESDENEDDQLKCLLIISGLLSNLDDPNIIDMAAQNLEFMQALVFMSQSDCNSIASLSATLFQALIPIISPSRLCNTFSFLSKSQNCLRESYEKGGVERKKQIENNISLPSHDLQCTH